MVAISWGSPIYKTISGRRHGIRLGVELTQSPATVTSSTSSVTVTAKIYLWSRYAIWDNSNSVSWSGSFGSGSTSFSFSTSNTSGWSSANVRLIRTLTRTVTPSPTNTVASSISASMSGVDMIPGTFRASGSITTGRKPLLAPATPTGAAATRVNDTQHTITWTRTNPSDPARPYTNVIVQRWDNISGAYRTIATLGNVSTYVDRATTAGRRYRWRVYAKNSGGTSGYAYSDYVYTAPPAPPSAKAVRAGGDITVTWPAVTAPSAVYRYEVVRQASGGAWDYAGAVSVEGTSWTDTNPDPTHTWKYAVRTFALNGSTRIFSNYVHTATVQLLTAPAAPTQLAPTLIEATEPTTLTWRHNPLDSSDQTAYELRHRRQGTTAWTTTPKTTSEQSTHALAGLEPGPGLEWQVRTWGAHADPSPWSALAAARVAQKPSVTLMRPTAETVESSSVSPWWTTFDPEGEGQRGWRVSIRDRDGITVWSGSGGTTTVARPNVRLQDGGRYTVVVRARAFSGLWSDPVEHTFDVVYAVPPAGSLTTDWDPDSGVMVVSISHPDPGPGEVEAVSCELWRSTAGGDWLHIAAGLPLDAVVTDPIVATSTRSDYKVVTVSALPSTSESPVVTVAPDPRGWVFLNAGPGWSQMVKVRDNVKTSLSFKRDAALHHMAGRARPISVRSDQQTYQVDVSARLAPNPDGGANWQELLEFVRTAEEPICYRDPKGHRLFVALNGVDGSAERIREEASFTVTEIDFDEQEAQ